MNCQFTGCTRLASIYRIYLDVRNLRGLTLHNAHHTVHRLYSSYRAWNIKSLSFHLRFYPRIKTVMDYVDLHWLPWPNLRGFTWINVNLHVFTKNVPGFTYKWLPPRYNYLPCALKYRNFIYLWWIIEYSTSSYKVYTLWTICNIHKLNYITSPTMK